MLNTNSRIAAILTPSESSFNFISPNFLLSELENHRNRLSRILCLEDSEVLELQHIVTRNIHFIPEEQIHTDNWILAEKLTSKVDADDIAFVALALELSCPIWTGDKRLRQGISSVNMLDTEQVWSISTN